MKNTISDEGTPSLNTPVLFLVFNRPEQTAQVFEAIRRERPNRLYVAADGPRPDRAGEASRVSEVRKIATDVDWECEVKTLFRNRNMGCKYAVSHAISWFFQQEQQGIILEDDCLPCPSFFRFCEWGLDAYKDRKEVWQINGNNFSADKCLYPGEVSFVSLPQAWGWATWSDRWRHYQQNIFTLKGSLDAETWPLTRLAANNKRQHINDLQNGLDTWDYQWQLLVLQNNGLVLSPRSNLISNLGDGEDATHTIHDRRVRLPTEPLVPPSVTPAPKFSPKLNLWYEKKMGLWSLKGAIKSQITSTRATAISMTKNAVRKILFRDMTPIVVASTGRAGSTMICQALIDALARSRFPRSPRWFQRFAARLSCEYLDDLQSIQESHARIIKTHDLFDAENGKNAKFIFIYGDPLESAQSVTEMWNMNGIQWVEEHIAHLRGDGSPYDIYRRDILNYEEQLGSWGEADGVFVVHYDDLWRKQPQLSTYAGLPIELPKRRARSEKELPPSYNEKLFDMLTRSCKSLREKISVP